MNDQKKQNWLKLKASNKLSDQRKALTLIGENPINAQKELINWFTQINYYEVREKISRMLVNESKLALIRLYKNSNNQKENTDRILRLIETINDESLKVIIIEYTLKNKLLNDQPSSSVLYFIREYMKSKKCTLMESRNFIEPFWENNKTIFE